jgi:ubiquinone/menaquinone biosynthesis C-methylase UbiE
MIDTSTFYKIFIDPLLYGLRTKISSLVEEDQSLVDIACGTGALAVHLCGRCSRVLGIDNSESMISAAYKIKEKLNKQNLDFLLINAADLKGIKDGEFDYATLSMALHQFPGSLRTKILLEMKRIAQRVIIADYSVPLPRGALSLFIPMIERMAGKEHHENFGSYQIGGGMDPLLKNLNFTVTSKSFVSYGVFQITLCG